MGLKTAIWWVTWKCNYHCVYCWQVQGQKVGDYLPTKLPPDLWQKWLGVWTRFRPSVGISITGGEPFLMSGFVDCMAGLRGVRFGLTSNLSHDLQEFTERVDPADCIRITCSIHPSEKNYNEALFMGRIHLLRTRGFPICVNFVGWPEQLYLARHYKNILERDGIHFHFDPYWSKYRPVQWSAADLREIESLRGPDRSPHPFTLGRGPDYRVLCSGGMDHLSVMPDGTAYRCIDDEQERKPPVGNVFDENFRLNDGLTPCARHSTCPNCDRDHVTVQLVV